MPDDFQYSMAYSKSGDAVFYSHLDTLRILERAVRRAGLETCFTRGCNPHIRLSFLTAIPVGLASNGEWFSLKLKQEVEPGELKACLERQLPAGFGIVRVCKGAPPKLEEDLPSLAVRYSGHEEEARTAASGFMDQDRIEIHSMRKGRQWISDVRPFFSDYKVEKDVIFFNIKELDGSKPRLSDLARALRSLDSCRTIEIREIKILRSGFSHDNGPET